MILWKFQCNEGLVAITLPVSSVTCPENTRPEDSANPTIEVLTRDGYEVQTFSFRNNGFRDAAFKYYCELCESYRPITRAEQEQIIRSQVDRSQQRVMPVGAPFLHGANITKA